MEKFNVIPLKTPMIIVKQLLGVCINKRGSLFPFLKFWGGAFPYR